MDREAKDDKIMCAYCASPVSPDAAWPHIDGDSNMGVKKIDYFCCESHKIQFLSS
jgi:hypothetical protein